MNARSKKLFNILKNDLIKEIIGYIPLKQTLTILKNINKRILITIKSYPSLNLLAKNLNYFLSAISYDNDDVENIKKEFEDKGNPSPNMLEEIILLLLAEKYKKYDYIHLKNDMLLHKYSKFLFISENIEAIFLKTESFNYGKA